MYIIAAYYPDTNSTAVAAFVKAEFFIVHIIIILLAF